MATATNVARHGDGVEPKAADGGVREEVVDAVTAWFKAPGVDWKVAVW
jgi:hypothetical protein